jgi:eukaryotic-like serine/threonine-protein kinase
MPKIADRYSPTGNAQWGGMGQVHECIDENLGRPVILKTVHRPEDEPRLMDERTALLALRSRHVAQLLDVVSFDHSGNSITCLVLEKIDGIALPMYSTPDRAFLKDAWQIATGLAHIHAAGIIHRDVKPENIKVDANGVVKILDFGLARQHGIDNRTRSIIGSPGFMAPELYSDQTITFSPAVDVFALGQTVRAMLGHAIQGTPPGAVQSGSLYYWPR